MSSFIQTLKTLTLATILSLGISYAYAWTAPTVEPTGGNTSAPINTSATWQTKSGTLTLNRTDGVPVLDTYGTTTLATVNGNVGIGTTDPRTILDLGMSFGVGDAGRKLSLWNNGSTFYGFSIHNGMMGISAGNVAGAADDVTILDNGNVGIGTTDPRTILDLVRLMELETLAENYLCGIMGQLFMDFQSTME